MRFKKDGYTFKASQIRRGLSYAVILSKLNANEEKEQQRTINSQSRQIQTEQPREETRSERQERNEPSIGIPSLGPSMTLPRKSSEDGCRRRKRNVDQDYEIQMESIAIEAHFASP